MSLVVRLSKLSEGSQDSRTTVMVLYTLFDVDRLRFPRTATILYLWICISACVRQSTVSQTRGERKYHTCIHTPHMLHRIAYDRFQCDVATFTHSSRVPSRHTHETLELDRPHRRTGAPTGVSYYRGLSCNPNCRPTRALRSR